MCGVKMSLQLYLILLMTSVLAEKDKATTESPIKEYFHWGDVDFQSVSLSWETAKLQELLDAEIIMEAVLTPVPGPERSTIAYLRDGEVTLDGLIPNSSYVVNATVVHNATTILELTNNIQTKVVDRSLIDKFFHWDSITAKSISLRWDLEGQDDLLDGEIQMMAVRDSDPTSKKTTSEPFSKGRATLDGLMSNSLYAVTVTATIGGYKYFDFTDNIKTLDTGHGKGGVAKTGGFGITSVVVGLLFTCMAPVLG